MRICSLLPSITEILFELGLDDQVVAVRHRCDWPPEPRAKPSVTRSRIRSERVSSGEIDRQVTATDGSLYDLDQPALARLQPDLILTQSLCSVCAVSETTVRNFADSLPGPPTVISYQPACLADVLAMLLDVGQRTGVPAGAERLCRRFRGEIERFRVDLAGRVDSRSVVCLEWTDPPFACGHWTPELVDIAGGRELLGRPGEPSRRVAWDDLLRANPEILLIAPCGYPLARTLSELAWLECQPGWTGLQAVRGGRVY